jgi:hypothetical protein
MDIMRHMSRAWYYFRIGYSTYLSFLLGYIGVLVSVYYLAIQSAPALKEFFPSFVPFAVLATMAAAPLAVGIGFIHLKKSRLYASEADIGFEASPYTYKIPIGRAREVDYKLNLMTVLFMKGLMAKHGILDPELEAELNTLEAKIKVLLDGGSVGLPS